MLQGRYGKYQFDQLRDQKCLAVSLYSCADTELQVHLEYEDRYKMRGRNPVSMGSPSPSGGQLRFMNIVGYMDTKVQQVRTRSNETFAFCGFYYWSGCMAFVASEFLTHCAHLSCWSESLRPCESSIAAQRTGQTKGSFKNIMWASSSLHHWHEYRSQIERWEGTHCVQNVWPARFRR